MEPRRRSNIVVLTLLGLPLGAAALADAFPGQQMRRNLYPDRAACERDYNPQQCAPNTSSGTSAGVYRSAGYHGPYFYADRTSAAARGDPGTGRTGFYRPTETSVRGGFGRFGRAFHAGG
ncbi:MAG TPA: hypothetical protein VJR70_00165 [Stellaceae bacterium]|nr:hypothetical protein [Stellaceae bacterium]